MMIQGLVLMGSNKVDYASKPIIVADNEPNEERNRVENVIRGLISLWVKGKRLFVIIVANNIAVMPMLKGQLQ